MNQYSGLDKIRYYRDEIRLEFNLLAMRSTILVTCQSFLVVPFGILHTAPEFARVAFITYLIAGLGIFVALLIRGPMNAAHRTMNKWMVRHRAMIKSSEDLRDFAIDRDLIPGVEQDIHRDRDHMRSLAFSVYGPWAFFAFWVAAVGLSVYRVLAGF
jgi:hypothetical protein